MTSWIRFRRWYAAGALILVLPLVAAGCGGGGEGDEGAAPTKDGAAAPGAGPPGGPGGPPAGPGGPPAGPGGPPAPPGGPTPRGAGGGGGGAAPAAGMPASPTIFFRQMKERIKGEGGMVSQPVPVAKKLPTKQVIRYFQFRYRVKGDPEAFLPFLLAPTSKDPRTGSVWLVEMPADYAKVKKTREEWENLFGTYVIADDPAVARAHQALQKNLAQKRKQMYPNRAYVIDTLAGDTLPATAALQAGDAVATATGSPEHRAALYERLAQQAMRAHRPDQARMFKAAARAAVADRLYEHGRDADALWLYQDLPRQAK